MDATLVKELQGLLGKEPAEQAVKAAEECPATVTVRVVRTPQSAWL